MSYYISDTMSICSDPFVPEGLFRMKTTLGVGISVLSALAAQGKDFDRAEPNAMLEWKNRS